MPPPVPHSKSKPLTDLSLNLIKTVNKARCFSSNMNVKEAAEYYKLVLIVYA